MAPIPDPSAFIKANTRVKPVPLAPEIRLYGADEAVDLWSRTEEALEADGLPAPFWAFAWAGGQALARHVLDHPALVRGKSVLDIGSGSGLVAIAAMKAGAKSVLAVDPDGFARAAIGLNAALNTVCVSVSGEDALAGDGGPCEIVLIGDLFYEAPVARAVLGFCERAAARGAGVYVGDPERSYFPRQRFTLLATHGVPEAGALEDMDIKRTHVWAFG